MGVGIIYCFRISGGFWLGLGFLRAFDCGVSRALSGTWCYKVSADLCVVQVWVLGFEVLVLVLGGCGWGAWFRCCLWVLVICWLFALRVGLV